MKTCYSLFILIFLSCSLFAQVSDSVGTAADSISTVLETPAEPFDVDAAVNEYLNSLTDEQKAKSDAYFEGGYWLLLWGILYEIFVAWIFLAKGLSGKIKSWASKVSGRTNLSNWIYLLIYSTFGFLLTLPFMIYQDFYREKQYDLLNLSFGGWITEQIQGVLISAIFMSLLFMVVYIVIRKAPKTWWVWGSVITIAFLMILILIAPVFLSPIFNDFKPLDEGPIKESILSMARANEVPTQEVWQFDASKQSDRISANVSGMGATIRISLNDNLLNRCDENEIKAVMAHELGHYRLNHTYELIIQFGLVILFAFAFIHWSYDKVLARWGHNWGIDGISDVAGFPLIMVLMSVFFFFAEPVTNSIIRTNEEEADNYGLNAAREPDGFAEVSMKLAEYRKIDPGYWEEIIFFDHPSGRNRVTRAMIWKAENLKFLKAQEKIND